MENSICIEELPPGISIQPANGQILENFISTETLASKTELKPSTIRSWAREGKIPAYKIAGQKGYRFLYSEVYRVIKEQFCTHHTIH